MRNELRKRENSLVLAYVSRLLRRFMMKRCSLFMSCMCSCGQHVFRSDAKDWRANAERKLLASVGDGGKAFRSCGPFFAPLRESVLSIDILFFLSQ